MYLLFDIGGTHSRFAISSDHQTLNEVKTIPTSQSFEDALSEYKKIISELSEGEKITACAGGVPAPLDPSKASFLMANNLPDWANQPIKEKFQEIVAAPVFLENDAALAGLGEAVFGAGKGRKIVAYLTISTGVGGARIVDGSIDQNSAGFEPGEQIIEYKTGTILADILSGKGLEKKYGEKPEQITNQETWEEIARALALAIHNSRVYWSPDIVVLGGSIMEKIDLEKTLLYLKEIPTVYPLIPEIKKSSLVGESGLYGALALLNQKNN